MTSCSIYLLNTEKLIATDFLQLLPLEERQRADRLINPAIKNNFIIFRGFLRQTLSKYTKCSPEKIIINYGEHGKPSVDGIHFNLSHSENLCVIAVSSMPIGIDLEYTSKSIDFLKIAKRYFSSQDFNFIKAAPDEKQKTLFYELWCKREAYSKMLGISVWNTLNKSSFQEFKNCFFKKIKISNFFYCILACAQEVTVNSMEEIPTFEISHIYD